MRAYWLAWSTLTWLSAMLCTSGCLLPYWLKGSLVSLQAYEGLHSDLGLYRRCTYPLYKSDGSIRVDSNCGHYQFGDLPHPLWKAALLLLAMDCCLLFFLTFFLFFIGFCLDLLREKAVIRACQWTQTLAGCLGLSACFLYPLGWSDNWEVQQICGHNAGRFSPGRCHVGWAFVLTLSGCVMTLLTTSLPIMMLYHKHQTNKVLDCSGSYWPLSSSSYPRPPPSQRSTTPQMDPPTSSTLLPTRATSLQGSHSNLISLLNGPGGYRGGFGPGFTGVRGGTETMRSSMCFPSSLGGDMESSVHTLMPASLQGSRVFLLSPPPVPVPAAQPSSSTQRRLILYPGTTLAADSASLCSMSPSLSQHSSANTRTLTNITRGPFFPAYHPPNSPLPETPLPDVFTSSPLQLAPTMTTPTAGPSSRRSAPNNPRFSYVSYQSLPMHPSVSE